MSDVAIRRLAGIDLFTGCRRSALQTIDQLTVTLDLPAGRALSTEGGRGGEFFVIVDGVATLQSSDGRAALLGPGAWFGEDSLFDNGPSAGTVKAVSDVTVLVFGRREFATLCADHPGVRARLEQNRRPIVMASTHDPVLVGETVLSR